MKSSVLRLTSNLYKILGDTNTVDIILKLKTGEKSFQQLQNELELSQSNLSHLMKKLTNSKITNYRTENRKKYYSINNINIFKILKETKNYLTEIHNETIEELKNFELYDI
jgi:ArsR family transcriptional regulator